MTYNGSLDTNVLLRFIVDDIPDQTSQAVALISQPARRYQVADAVWIEIAYALEHHYLMKRADISQAITSMLEIDCLVTNQNVITQSCADFHAHPMLSFADCYLSAHARNNAATPLFTFDRKLANQLAGAAPVPMHGHPSTA